MPQKRKKSNTKLRRLSTVWKDLMTIITMINVWYFRKLTGGGESCAIAALLRGKGYKFNGTRLIDHNSLTVDVEYAHNCVKTEVLFLL